MSEITADVHALFAKGKATRTELLYLNPPVKRVDEYAGTQLTATVDQFRGTFDTIQQAQKETCVDLKSAITNYLMLHEEANDPSSAGDIIIEFENQLKTLGRGEGRADTSASIDALLAQVNAFSKEFGSTVESKDAAIAIELAEATKEVSNLDAEIGKVDKELADLRKRLAKGSIAKAIDATKDLFKSKKGTDATTAGTSDGNPAHEEEIKRLEAERAALVEKLETARDQKIRATAASEARDAADTPATIAAITKAEADIAAYNTESAKLTVAWTAMTKEVEEYHALFVANRDHNTTDTQRALSDHIAKVTSTQAELATFAKALGEAPYNA